MSVLKIFIKFLFLSTIFPSLIFHSDDLFAQSEWKIPIVISSENWQATLCFGVHSNGSDSYDVGLDTLSPPPGFGPYAFFTIPTFPNYLLTDIRKPQDQIIWRLKTANCAGKTVKIKWDLRNLNLTGNETIEILDYTIITGLDSLLIAGDISLEIKYSNSISSYITNGISEQKKKISFAAYPNPFNQYIIFRTNIERMSNIKFDIVDINGKLITTLFVGLLTGGIQNIYWDGTDDNNDVLSTGIYFCRLLVNDQVFNQKILLLK